MVDRQEILGGVPRCEAPHRGTSTPEYTVNDVLIYSPLCLALAAGLAALEKPTVNGSR
ncbi:MAG: hypothetical protein ACK5MP_02745 [Nostocoides sp.]